MISGSVHVECASCHPANSAKALKELKEAQRTDLNQGELSTGHILSSSTTRLQREAVLCFLCADDTTTHNCSRPLRTALAGTPS